MFIPSTNIKQIKYLIEIIEIKWIKCSHLQKCQNGWNYKIKQSFRQFFRWRIKYIRQN
jgi:hypothetical protein